MARKNSSIPVPADSVEANDVLRRIGEIERETADIEAAYEEQVAALRKDFDERRSPLDVEFKRITKGLEIFADDSREDLLKDGKKTVELSAGKFGWRLNSSAKVSHGNLKEETVIERIKALGKAFSDKYIRTKETLNKEAMLEDRPKIPGVTYPQPEKFFYESVPAVKDEEAASNVVRLSEAKAA